MKNSSTELGSLIQGFKFTCETECKSPKTVEWYCDFLGRFHRFLQQSKMPTAVSQIDKNHIRGFIRYLQTKARTPRKLTPLSGTTVQGYVRTLKRKKNEFYCDHVNNAARFFPKLGAAHRHLQQKPYPKSVWSLII